MAFQAPVVHNRAAHLTSAMNTFNAHADGCNKCFDPISSYNFGDRLCEQGLALSEALREAFFAQERQLEFEWPEAYRNRLVRLVGVTGPAAGIVEVMNIRRSKRLNDELQAPRTVPAQPLLTIEAARRGSRYSAVPMHSRSLSDDRVSSSTYYSNYSGSSGGAQYAAGSAPNPYLTPRSSVSPQIRSGYPVVETRATPGRRGDERRVRFE